MLWENATPVFCLSKTAFVLAAHLAPAGYAVAASLVKPDTARRTVVAEALRCGVAARQI